VYFAGAIFNGVVGDWMNKKSSPIHKLLEGENKREINKA
jgi:hypothetical protein